jgi:hypothetical protein
MRFVGGDNQPGRSPPAIAVLCQRDRRKPGGEGAARRKLAAGPA